MSTQQSNGNRPAHTIRHGRIKATIWLNQTQKGPMFNVTFSRSYQNDSGSWADSPSFNFEDLMTVAKCAFDAHTWISTERAKNAQDSSQREDDRGNSSKKAPPRHSATA
jgi:hypothetical protein